MNIRRRTLFVDLRRDGTVAPPPEERARPSPLTTPSYNVSVNGGSSDQAAQQGSQLTRPRAGTLLQGLNQKNETEFNQDSITLKHLKALNEAATKEKEKTYQFDYRYDDSDTLMNELDEFYPYVEVPLLKNSPERFKGSFPGDWTETSAESRREFIEVQLEYLESPKAEVRRKAQENLLYLLQGNFGETNSPEMQLHWVIENAKTVRSVDGVATLVVALKDALRRYHLTAEPTGERSNSQAGGTSGISPVDPYDDRSAELMDVVAMIYFVVEVFRSDDTFGDELMAMTPPLPTVLFRMLASLKDQLPKGFPVKKMLLLVWKVLLACLGGMREVNKAKTLARELSGLPMGEKDFTKSSPADIASWRRDTSVKYPTFAPPPSSAISSIPNDKLFETILPIPSRPNYHSTELPPAPNTSLPLPGTPAPSPPPSPAPIAKPKKQQYQTDPTRPFVFPYSRVSGSAGPSSLVPFAIEEADRLYHRHAYVSLSLYQLWETREECIREERGLGKNGLIGFEDLRLDDEEDEVDDEMLRVEWRFEAEEMECEERGDKEGAKRAKERKLAARRLHRADILYRNTLPIMQSCVVVLLKLLLATVTGPATTNTNVNYAMANPAFTSPTQELPNQINAEPPAEPVVPPPSPEEIDVARHKEITSKAVSAILILLLKWFKASHTMKGHYLAQLLFDSNCLLLVLKMFGLADVFASVQTKNEVEDSNFFQYCYLNCSKGSPDSTDRKTASTPVKSEPKLTQIDGQEVYIVSDYSWRNFFSTINFLKVVQKMTKHRLHRTFMLSQYKASQILKRILRVGHPMMQLQVLKLIKSQMPHCGRKWRQANMKVITSIYLNCRPDLRDEWLAGQDIEVEPEESQPQELALRNLIQFYNKRNYPTYLVPAPAADVPHHRAGSVSGFVLEDPPVSAPSHSPEQDVFPPRKTDVGMAYNPDGMIEFWLHEYEDVLLEVFGDSDVAMPVTAGHHDDMDDLGLGRGVAERDGPAWKMLGELMRARGGVDDDGISDSESVVSVGELGQDARMDGLPVQPENPGENTWEHLSEKTLSLLPRSPAERRRSSARRRSSSSSSPLRPVIPSAALGDLGALDSAFDDEDEMDMPGPMPIVRDTQDEQDRDFGAVDEVEYAYGE